MGLRSGWLVGAGCVVFSAVACSGHLANDDDPNGVGGGGAGGSPAFPGGKPGSAGSPSSPHGGTGALPSFGGSANFPGGAGGWYGGYAGAPDYPAGAGGVAGLPDFPNYCERWGSCAGSPGDFAGAGGVGEDLTPGECDSGKGCIVAQGSAIRDLTADSSDLYWVEHGTFDDLGNYDNDGRLLKRGLAAGSTVLPLATGLAGPVGIGLTTTHVFVYLDQVWEGKPRFALARVPMAGGAAQVVQLDAWTNGEGGGDCVGCLVNAGDTMYFPLRTGVYKIAAQDAQPTQVSTLRASSLAIAGEYLYLVTSQVAGIWRIPLAGGAPEQLSADPRLNIQVAAGYLYSLDNTNTGKAYLARMPVTGGPWIRLPKVRSAYAYQLQISGSWFFQEMSVGSEQQLLAGSLDDTGAAVVPLAVPWGAVEAWVGTAQGIFWSGGQVIRQRFNTP